MKNEKKANQIFFDAWFFSLWKVSLIPHTRTRLKTQQQNTYLQTMFAATQQIASIAGLKATKVQVRTLSSSSQYSFSGKDLVAFGARARFSLNSLFAYPTLKDTKIHTWEKKGPFGDDGNLSLARAREKDPSLRV